MRSMVIDSNNRINNNLNFLEMYFNHQNHDAVVQMPKKSIKTLFYNIKPNNRNNLKQLNFFPLNKQMPLPTLQIKNQPKIKGTSFYDLFFDKNQSIPFYQNETNSYLLRSTTFSSKQNLNMNKTRTQTPYSFEEMKEQKNVGNYSLYKSNIINGNHFNISNGNMNNSLRNNYNSLTATKLYKTQKNINYQEPIYKDLNTLYQEFIKNVIYIIFIIYLIFYREQFKNLY